MAFGAADLTVGTQLFGMEQNRAKLCNLASSAVGCQRRVDGQHACHREGRGFF